MNRLYDEVIQYDIQGDLTEKFLRIFPSWQVMLATFIALAIIFIFFIKFLWKPIKKMHDERRDYIQENIDGSKKAYDDAQRDRAKTGKLLDDTNARINDLIAKAKLESTKIKSDHLEQAKKEAQLIIEQSNKRIENEKARFELEKKEAIIELALDAASKVIEKDTDNEINRNIIKKYIETK